MKSDIFSNPIFQEQDLIDLIYKNKLDLLGQVLMDDSDEIKKFKELSNLDLNIVDKTLYSIPREDFDKACQQDWFMPAEYKELDIEKWLIDRCTNSQELDRITEELAAFKNKNMLDVLRLLKYLVDTLREHKILWGVGRGSSVASYVLYKIGIHRIDSIKYNLDWKEFLR